MNKQAIVNHIKGLGHLITPERFFMSAVFVMATSFGYVVLHFVSKYW